MTDIIGNPPYGTNEKATTNVIASSNTQLNHNTRTSANQEETQLLPDVTPWPEPVDGSALANELVDTITKYIYLPDGAAEFATIWIEHTYLSNDYMFTPRLIIYSPEPRCGKTTFLDLLEYLCNKPLQVSGITGSSMARMITLQRGQVTLLADEADRYLNNDNDTLCKVLNSGYQRGKKIMCTETSGRNMNPKLFECFAPCAIAGIGNIPTTVKDRGLIITMKRKTSTDRVEKLRYREVHEHMEELRQKCKRFIKDHEEEIINRIPDIPSTLNDRTADVSEILFAIADTISPEWHQRLETAILKLIKNDRSIDELSTRTQLLVDIKSIFEDVPKGWLSSKDLLDKLTKIETSPWPEWNKGHPMTTSALASQLKFFGIKPKQTRENRDDRSRKYYVSDFQDAFNRYVPVSSCDTVTTSANSTADCHTVTTEYDDDDIDLSQLPF